MIGLWTADYSFGQGTTCDTVHTIVDQMPTYGKRQEDLLKYLRSLKLDRSCRPEELKRLIWTINKDGKLVDIDVVGLEGECRTRIIEQLKAFPAWTPGRLHGELVCVRMIVPIHIPPEYD